jgi:hypothetical protein
VLNRSAHHTLQLDCETGVGLNGIDPTEVVETDYLNTEDSDRLVTEDSGFFPPSATQSSMQDMGTSSTGSITAASNGSIIVALSFSGLSTAPLGAQFATSTDGLNWTSWSVVENIGIATNGYNVAFLNNEFLISIYTGLAIRIYASNTGLTWTLRSNTVIGAPMVDMAYGNGVWVGVRGVSNSYWTSTDAMATLTAGSFPAGFNASRVCFNGTHFVASEPAGRAAYSTNGTSWTLGAYVFGSPSSDWIGIAAGAGCVIMRRNGFNYGARSTDNGATWSLVAMPAQNAVARMTFADSRFAMADNATTNALAYSIDGITWSNLSVPTARPYQGIAPFGNFAVSVGGGSGGLPPNYSALWNLGYDNDFTYLILDKKRTPGVIPKVMLRWSDDGGHTWSNEHWRELGRQGQYGTRVIWRRLGMTMKLRDRVYEVSGTDPVRIYIMGAELDVSPTRD